MHDILIIGAGPLGLALALALKQHGMKARVIEARADAGHRDGRVLALSEGSRQILGRLGAWPQAATPIRQIHISQQGGFGRTLLDAADYRLDALGFVLPAAMLTDALLAACDRDGIAIEYGASVVSSEVRDDRIEARCADGRRFAARLLCRAEGSVEDGSRTRDYQQDAIVCMARPASAHRNLALERFTPAGPFALLPCGHDYSVVMTAQRDAADALMQASDAALLERLHSTFGSRVKLLSLGPRGRYPLTLRYRDSVIAARTAWLGNAAQTLHPVAGQGFNLALRDGWSLAREIARAPADPGSAAVLGRYQAARKFDRVGTIGFTHALIGLFANDDGLLRAARGVGLFALDALPPLRHFVARRMMFGARGG